MPDDLKERFAPLAEHLLGVLLWGSRARGEGGPRSDTDICLVAGGMPPSEALGRAWRLADLSGDTEWDLHVFEELPDHLKAAVLRDHQVLVAADRGELYEYLRPFQRRWWDQAHRQRIDMDTVRRSLAAV